MRVGAIDASHESQSVFNAVHFQESLSFKTVLIALEHYLEIARDVDQQCHFNYLGSAWTVHIHLLSLPSNAND